MSNAMGTMAPQGALGLRVVRSAPGPRTPLSGFSFAEIKRDAYPQKGLPLEVNNWREVNWPAHVREAAYQLRFAMFMDRLLTWPGLRAWSKLHLEVIRANGMRLDYGVAGLRMVTTVGVNFIVDAFQNTTELENFKYHALGTGGGAEAITNTTLTTEITTEYASNNVRPTGSTTEGSGANVYRTVGTNTVDGSVAATEHGIFDQASNAGGTLLDKTLFSVITLASADSLVSTYDLTFSAGG